jgi:hypothetical protein
MPPFWIYFLVFCTICKHELTFYIVLLVDMDWMHLEVGLKWACWWLYADILFGSFRPKSEEKLPNFAPAGLEPMLHATVALTAQYMNVRQRKLGTIIIQTVNILSAVTDSLPEGEFVHGHSSLLPNYLARQYLVPLHLCINTGGQYCITRFDNSGPAPFSYTEKVLKMFMKIVLRVNLGFSHGVLSKYLNLETTVGFPLFFMFFVTIICWIV